MTRKQIPEWPFRNLFPEHLESFRTDPKNVLYLVLLKTVKHQSELRFIRIKK